MCVAKEIRLFMEWSVGCFEFSLSHIVCGDLLIHDITHACVCRDSSMCAIANSDQTV